MKRLFVLACLLTSVASYSYGADRRETAIQAFKDSPAVKAAIEKGKAELIVGGEEGNIETASLRGGCGFGGCDYEFLVIQSIQLRGTNAQWDSVAAIVMVPARGEPSVTLVTVATSDREKQ